MFMCGENILFYFILFYLNWQTEQLESDITPILRNESIQSDILKKAYIFFKFNCRFIFLCMVHEWTLSY